MTQLMRIGVFTGNRIHQIRRDPFARATLLRESFHNRPFGTGYLHSCAWCGQSRTTMYYYAWESDSRGGTIPSSLYPENRCFCCVGCWESYSC